MQPGPSDEFAQEWSALQASGVSELDLRRAWERVQSSWQQGHKISLSAALGRPLAAPKQPSLRVPEEHYEITEELGRGGMGLVVRARDRRLQREVAMKLILSSDPAAHLRFLEEARLTGQLEHPNIVPVHELSESTRPYFTMKYVRGRSLADLIRRPPADFNLTARLELFLKVLDAIAFAHAEGILHRDLKPANIMTGEFGEVLVMDWGLAIRKDLAARSSAPAGTTPLAELASDERLTQQGVALGTVGYMAPEQAAAGPIDERADIFSLGAILFEMLTGELAFQGPMAQVMAAYNRGEAPDPATRRPDLNIAPELAAVTCKALAMDPEERYENVRALRDDLMAFLEGRSVSVRADSVATRLRKWTRRNPALALLFIVLTGLAAGLTWVLAPKPAQLIIQLDGPGLEGSLANLRLSVGEVQALSDGEGRASLRFWPGPKDRLSLRDERFEDQDLLLEPALTSGEHRAVKLRLLERPARLRLSCPHPLTLRLQPLKAGAEDLLLQGPRETPFLIPPGSYRASYEQAGYFSATEPEPLVLKSKLERSIRTTLTPLALWQMPLPQRSLNRFLEDLDQDGRPELLLITAGDLSSWDISQGRPLWRRAFQTPIAPGQSTSRYLAVLRSGGDGSVLIACFDGDLLSLIDGQTGERRLAIPHSGGQPYAAELDGKPGDELVLTSAYSGVQVFNQKLERLWSAALGKYCHRLEPLVFSGSAQPILVVHAAELGHITAFAGEDGRCLWSRNVTGQQSEVSMKAWQGKAGPRVLLLSRDGLSALSATNGSEDWCIPREDLCKDLAGQPYGLLVGELREPLAMVWGRQRVAAYSLVGKGEAPMSRPALRWSRESTRPELSSCVHLAQDSSPSWLEVSASESAEPGSVEDLKNACLDADSAREASDQTGASPVTSWLRFYQERESPTGLSLERIEERSIHLDFAVAGGQGELSFPPWIVRAFGDQSEQVLVVGERVAGLYKLQPDNQQLSLRGQEAAFLLAPGKPRQWLSNYDRRLTLYADPPWSLSRRRVWQQPSLAVIELDSQPYDLNGDGVLDLSLIGQLPGEGYALTFIDGASGALLRERYALSSQHCAPPIWLKRGAESIAIFVNPERQLLIWRFNERGEAMSPEPRIFKDLRISHTLPCLSGARGEELYFVLESLWPEARSNPALRGGENWLCALDLTSDSSAPRVLATLSERSSPVPLMPWRGGIITVTDQGQLLSYENSAQGLQRLGRILVGSARSIAWVAESPEAKALVAVGQDGEVGLRKSNGEVLRRPEPRELRSLGTWQVEVGDIDGDAQDEIIASSDCGVFRIFDQELAHCGGNEREFARFDLGPRLPRGRIEDLDGDGALDLFHAGPSCYIVRELRSHLRPRGWIEDPWPRLRRLLADRIERDAASPSWAKDLLATEGASIERIAELWQLVAGTDARAARARQELTAALPVSLRENTRLRWRSALLRGDTATLARLYDSVSLFCCEADPELRKSAEDTVTRLAMRRHFAFDRALPAALLTEAMARIPSAKLALLLAYLRLSRGIELESVARLFERARELVASDHERLALALAWLSILDRIGERDRPAILQLARELVLACPKDSLESALGRRVRAVLELAASSTVTLEDSLRRRIRGIFKEDPPNLDLDPLLLIAELELIQQTQKRSLQGAGLDDARLAFESWERRLRILGPGMRDVLLHEALISCLLRHPSLKRELALALRAYALSAPRGPGQEQAAREADRLRLEGY